MEAIRTYPGLCSGARNGQPPGSANLFQRTRGKVVEKAWKNDGRVGRGDEPGLAAGDRDSILARGALARRDGRQRLSFAAFLRVLPGPPGTGLPSLCE